MLKARPCNPKLLDTKRSSVRKQGQHQGGAEELWYAEDAHLGDRGLEYGEEEPLAANWRT